MHGYASAANGSLILSGRAVLAETPRRRRAELSNDVTTGMSSRLIITVQDSPVSSWL
jgi:hypothetical protein